MATETEGAGLFNSFLRNAGYSDESIVRDYRVAGAVADFAIVNPHTAEPLMLFEVKTGEIDQVLAKARGTLSALRRAIDPQQVTTYAVRVTPSSGGVQVFEVADGEPKLVNTNLAVPPRQAKDASASSEASLGPVDTGDRLPNMEQARVAARSKTWARVRGLARNTNIVFSVVCVTLAIATGIFFYLDATQRLTLDPTGLVLLGATFALILAPFARRFRFLGIEVERLRPVQGQNEQESESPR